LQNKVSAEITLINDIHSSSK